MKIFLKHRYRSTKMEVVDISLTENFQHVVELSTEEECKRLVKSHKKVVLKFYADWCGPCKRISRLYESLCEDYADIVFAKIEMTDKDNFGVKEKINAFPTFKFYFNEKEIDVGMGANNDSLKQKVHALSQH